MGEVVKLASDYKPSVTVRKGILNALGTLGAIAGVAIIEALTNPETVKIIWGQAKGELLAVALITGAAKMIVNYRKNKNR